MSKKVIVRTGKKQSLEEQYNTCPKGLKYLLYTGTTLLKVHETGRRDMLKSERIGKTEGLQRDGFFASLKSDTGESETLCHSEVRNGDEESRTWPSGVRQILRFAQNDMKGIKNTPAEAPRARHTRRALQGRRAGLWARGPSENLHPDFVGITAACSNQESGICNTQAGSSASRTRTCNPAVNSRMLYH